jgi:hypothetical protein
MKQEHLSSQQIEELIIDGPGRRNSVDRSETEERDAVNTAWQHLEGCEVCKSDKDRLDAFVQLYRESASIEASMAEARMFAGAPLSPRPVWSMWQVAKWGLAFVLLLGVFLPILLHQRPVVPQQPKESVTAQMANDDLLLQQVDQEVTDSVPQPLASLANLVVDGDNANEQGGSQ